MIAGPPALRPTDLVSRYLPAICGAGLIFIAAVAIAQFGSTHTPPPITLICVAGLGGLGLLALAIARYDYAVGFAFAISGYVNGVPTPSDLVIFVIIMAALATGRFEAKVPLAAGCALAGFVAINVLTTSVANDMQTASNYLLIVIALATMAVWLSGYVDSERRARIVMGCYLGAALVSAVIGVLALVGPLPHKEIFLYGYNTTTVGYEQSGLRARAFFDDPNVFGPFLVPIFLVLLEDLLTPRLFRIRPVLKVGMLSILIAGIVASASRGAWIAVLAALAVLVLVMAARRRGSRRVLPLLLVLVSGALIVGGVISLAGNQAGIADRFGRQEYDQSRFAAQDEGIALAVQHPFGIGPGQFEDRASYGGTPIAAHSLYIRALTEEGVLGLLSLSILVLATLIYAVRAAARTTNFHGIGTASLLAAWSGIVIHSFFVDSLTWRHAWLVAALIWATAATSSRSSPSSGGYAVGIQAPRLRSGEA